jgi:hypothetical protein
MRVEVVYALPLEQDCSSVELPAGATIREAVQRSGVLMRHPQIDCTTAQVGIWGRPAGWDKVLRDGDRVEIYRPLQADAKDLRRRRVAGKAGEGR